MKKNILVLYDERSTYTSTVKEHVAAFKDFSRHNIFYAPGTNLYWPNDMGFTSEYQGRVEIGRKWKLDYFDAIVVHYSIRSNIIGYMYEGLRSSLKKFKGLKVLFIQDEYNDVDVAVNSINDISFDIIYTCIPEDSIKVVYAGIQRNDVVFIRNLTGYVPYLDNFEHFAVPLEQRKLLVGYRGRKLPHHYGLLGYDKYWIGEGFKEAIAGRDIAIDVETDDEKRIYSNWYEFLGSCRAMLGTPSGANIFDFDGSLKQKAMDLADRPFAEVYGENFARYDGVVNMEQISPKIFEAIILRTALVLFPGNYSGILEEGRHFIRLEKDFSNINDVLSKLADIAFLQSLTKRAYEEVVEPEEYSYKKFILDFDDLIDRHAHGSSYKIISTPIAVCTDAGIDYFGYQVTSDFLLNNFVLSGDDQREQFRSHFEKPEPSETESPWNCARAQDGAKIQNSSLFYAPPHDVSSLLRSHIRGNYAAAIENQPLPQFIEIDLGSVRKLYGLSICWLDSNNLASEYTVSSSLDGQNWDVLKEELCNSVAINTVNFDERNARFLRLSVSKLLGQQRLLMCRFEAYAYP